MVTRLAKEMSQAMKPLDLLFLLLRVNWPGLSSSGNLTGGVGMLARPLGLDLTSACLGMVECVFFFRGREQDDQTRI